ncbi:expressed unknown protein [Seminavis robusta]|uniref:Uncharacterized protein n=1 Tax=Seminavis robusta TaxID=568900 RepID=A0A9N8EVS0_9STRA|nr:expressed unknown protein [Seminavis robusta]|eukprot:Sro1704_g292370.1 n/a (545) ;mRNA; r:8269-9903
MAYPSATSAAATTRAIFSKQESDEARIGRTQDAQLDTNTLDLFFADENDSDFLSLGGQHYDYHGMSLEGANGVPTDRGHGIRQAYSASPIMTAWSWLDSIAPTPKGMGSSGADLSLSKTDSSKLAPKKKRDFKVKVSITNKEGDSTEHAVIKTRREKKTAPTSSSSTSTEYRYNANSTSSSSYPTTSSDTASGVENFEMVLKEPTRQYTAAQTTKPTLREIDTEQSEDSAWSRDRFSGLRLQQTHHHIDSPFFGRSSSVVKTLAKGLRQTGSLLDTGEEEVPSSSACSANLDTGSSLGIRGEQQGTPEKTASYGYDSSLMFASFFSLSSMDDDTNKENCTSYNAQQQSAFIPTSWTPEQKTTTLQPKEPHNHQIDTQEQEQGCYFPPPYEKSSPFQIFKFKPFLAHPSTAWQSLSWGQSSCAGSSYTWATTLKKNGEFTCCETSDDQEVPSNFQDEPPEASSTSSGSLSMRTWGKLDSYRAFRLGGNVFHIREVLAKQQARRFARRIVLTLMFIAVTVVIVVLSIFLKRANERDDESTTSIQKI